MSNRLQEIYNGNRFRALSNNLSQSSRCKTKRFECYIFFFNNLFDPFCGHLFVVEDVLKI